MQVDDILRGIIEEDGITRDPMEHQCINAPQQRVTYKSGFHMGLWTSSEAVYVRF